MTGRLATRAGLVLLLWFLGGRVGLLVGLAVALWDQFWTPSPALLLRAALLGFCLLPLAVLLRGLPTATTVSPLFAGGNLVAHYLAGTALALLVLGILRDVRPAPRLSGPGNGPPPPGADDLLAPLPPPPARELPAPAGAADTGNGARELQPPTPALPSATHPPLWAPGRRGGGDAPGAGGREQPPGETTAPSAPAGADPPAAETGTAPTTATHPPLWDPARPPTGDAAAGRQPADTGHPAATERAPGEARRPPAGRRSIFDPVRRDPEPDPPAGATPGRGPEAQAGPAEPAAKEGAGDPPERASPGPPAGAQPEGDGPAGQPAPPTREGGPAAPGRDR